MKKNLLIFFLAFLSLQGWAQTCVPCSSTTYNVDLSSQADTVWNLTNVSRNGSCCGANANDPCIRFNVTVNPASTYLSLTVLNPAPNGAAAFYQVNCGTTYSLGTPLCLTGQTTVCISFCKSGNDQPIYRITASRAVSASPDLNLRVGCTGTMNVTGLTSSSVVWNSVFPGAPGTYNSYLSCTLCPSTNVTPAAGAPAFIDYEVRGTILGCGTMGRDTVRVYTFPVLTGTIAPANPTICSTGSNTTTLTAMPSGGLPPYKYSWSGGQTTQSITVNSIGTYTVTIRDSLTNCAPVIVSTTVTQATPATPVAGGTNPVCSGNTIFLTASFIANATYSWIGPNGFTSTLQNPNIPGATTAASGTYTVRASVAGCSSLPATTTVVVNLTPNAPTATSNSPVCTGNQINLFAAAVAGGTYAWTGPNGFTSTLQNPTIANATLAMAGVYNVRVTVSGCPSVSEGTTSVIVNPTPPSSSASSNSPVCSGNNLDLMATSIPGGSYAWTGPNGFTSNLQNPTIANSTVAATGIYTVITSVFGCPSLPATTPVTVNQTPAAPLAGNNTPVCNGSTVDLTASTIAGATYAWIGPNNFISNVQNPSIPNATVAASGTYSVTATVNGCPSAPRITNVVVNPTPPAPSVTSNSPVCPGATVRLFASSIPGATYSWTGPNGFTSGVQNPTIANATIANSGIYTAIAIVLGCPSAADSTVSFIVNPVSIAPIASSNSPVCSGNILQLNAVASAQATYNWTGPNGFTSTAQNPTIPNVTLAASGQYTVTATLMGCTSATPATLPVIIKETPAILPVSSNSPLCSGDTLKLTSSLVAGASYNWTGPNGFTSTLQNPIIPRAQVTATGIYSVTASMAGCTSAAATTPVTVNPTPAVDAGPDRIIFLNQVITLNPIITGTNLQYLWTPNLYLSSNTVRNPTATGVEDILYRLNVTSAFGCKNSDSIFIKVLKPFVIPNTFTPNNDGIHDYWVIPNLPGYPDALVQVFTRTGQKVFEQRGYYKPWDGNMNGKSLPFDTYYYIVEAGNGLRPQTGYVTIVK